MHRIRNDLLFLAKVAAIFLVPLSLAGVSNFDSYYTDLASHFPLQYLFAALMTFLIFLSCNSRTFAILSLIIVGINAAILFPYLPTSSHQPSASKGIKVLSGNILSSNQQYASFLTLLEREQVDVVAALEINNKWANELKKLEPNYPFYQSSPREDNFGIALYSKLPLSNVRTVSLGDFQPPSIVAESVIDNQTVIIIATHPLPPASPQGYQFRNEQLEKLAEQINESEIPTLVIGDLNTTMWSATFRKLIDRTGLIDPRKGIGILPSWPRQLPFLYIPIDQVLSTKTIKIENLKTVVIDGSDHLGLVASAHVEH